MSKSYINALHEICDAFKTLQGVEDYENKAETYLECFEELVKCLYEVNEVEMPDFEGVETYKDWMTELVKIVFIMNENEVPENLKTESYGDIFHGLIDAYSDTDIESIPNKNVYLECMKALLVAIYASVNITDYSIEDITIQECLYQIAEAIEKSSAALGEQIEVNEETTEPVVVSEGETANIKLSGENINVNVVNNGSLIISGEGKFSTESTTLIENNGTLFIKDGTFDCMCAGKAVLVNNPEGELTINGGKFDRTLEFHGDLDKGDPNAYYTLENHGKVIINDGVFESLGGNASLIENGWNDGSKNTSGKDSVLIINGGTFKNGLAVIKNDECGVLEINDGEFINDVVFKERNFPCIQNWNKCTINGGNFKSSTTAIMNGVYNEYSVGELTINGGEFTCDKENFILMVSSGSVGNIGNVTINGGTFNSTITSEENLDKIKM